MIRILLLSLLLAAAGLAQRLPAVPVHRDAATWTPLPTLATRDDFAMAYDAARDRGIVFAGFTCNHHHRGDTLEWDGLRWLGRRPPASAPRRLLHQLAYDYRNQALLLFGGYVNDNYANQAWLDQWLWDGREWRDVTPMVMPPWRVYFAMAGDPVHQRVVMFGGALSLSGPLLDDTWEWDGTAWTQINPSTHPYARWGAAMAFCGASGRMILFGGGALNPWIDTHWEYDVGTSTWSQFTGTTPYPRMWPSSCEMPWNGHVLMFGGGVGSYNQTWEFDGTSWTYLNPPHRPAGRLRPWMAPNMAQQHVMLYGSIINTSTGAPGTDPNDQAGSTWIFQNGDWQRLAHLDPPPLPGSLSALEEYPPRDRLLFLNADTTVTGFVLQETWVLEDRQFRRLPTAPSPRTHHSFALGGCHEGLGLTVVHGKVPGGPWPWPPATWYWDGTSWAYQSAPFDFQETTYDPDRQALVAIRKTTQEIYEWYGPTQGWSLRQGAQVPLPSRNGFVFCYDRARHRLVYAGGDSATSSHDDTWEFDGVSWQQIPMAAKIPSRLRLANSSRYVPEVGGILAILRRSNLENETWVYDGTGWRLLPVERGLPYIGVDQPYRIAYDPLRGRVRTIRAADCNSAQTDSQVWTLEFRTLLPDTYLPQLGSTLHFDVDAPTQPHSFFGVLLSGHDHPGIVLPGTQRILPLRNDWLLQTGLWPGLSGVLDANGRANPALRIVNAPALQGFELCCAMVTLTQAGNLGVVSNGVVLTLER